MVRRTLGYLWAVCMVATASMSFAAWANGPRHGGTVNILINPEPPVLVSVATTSTPAIWLSSKVIEGLLAYNFSLEPLPQLAASWAVSPDGKQYTFKLREGVKWHDGKPFTSEDVAFSINLLKRVHPRGRSTFANVTEVQTPDPHTAVVVLSSPAPYLLYALAAGESPILPKHLYETGEVVANPRNSAPIGTGPYVFKEWVKGSHVIYERNPEYWDKPKPYLDRVIARFIPDAASRAIALENGTVDIAPGTPVPMGDLERLAKVPRLAFDTNGYQYYNYILRAEFNLENPILANEAVRKAIAHAVDREQLLKVVWYGYGAPIYGPFSPNLKRYAVGDLPRHAFSLKEAERLLDAAGYPRKPDGSRLELTVDYLPLDPFKRTAEFLRQSLGRVGIKLTVRSQDYPAYIKRVYTDRQFDISVHNMANMFDPTIGVQRIYWSKNFKVGVPFSNGAKYINPRVDALLEAAAREVDEDKRRVQFEEFQRIVASELPDINLLKQEYVTIYNRRVKNHTVFAVGIGGNLADAYIDESGN